MRFSSFLFAGATVFTLVACGQNTPVVNPPRELQVQNANIPPNFALIPAGTFTMGDPSGQEFSAKPAHQVTISKPFLMQKTHVTVGQFKAFVKSAGYVTDAEKGDGAHVWDGHWVLKKNANWRKPNFSQSDQHPVVCVTWNDAQAFIAWMNQKEPGMGYRLPTEAEWEYACRAGTTGPLYGELDAIAWYVDNSGMHTHPVGQKQPNAFGLYDMNGNASQWCQDWFDENYYTSSPSIDPQGPSSSIYDFRVLRGGSWFTYHSDCRSNRRIQPTPDDRYSQYGFRLVSSITETH